MDYNNGGKIDIISGDTRGNVWIFINIGTKTEPKLAEAKAVKADGKAIKRRALPLAQSHSNPYMADWDADGLKDLFVGHDYSLLLYKNIGTPTEPKFQAPVKLTLPGGKTPSRPSAIVVDWDRDGKQDLLLATESAGVLFYKNTGTTTEPKLADAKRLVNRKTGVLAKSFRYRAAVTDWNNDGKLDLLVGTFYNYKRPKGGNVCLFLDRRLTTLKETGFALHPCSSEGQRPSERE